MAVILIHKKMRTTTNFFLTNLAFADFAVGVFCVFPSMYVQLWRLWPLGDVMCKFYKFVMGTSYSASILILVVISVERYLAIMLPMRSRQLLTRRRLLVTTVCLWILAVANNVHKLVLFEDAEPLVGVHMCILLKDVSTEKYDVANFCLWYVLPLFVIAYIYVRISVTLWRSTTSRAVSVEMRNLHTQSRRDAKQAKRRSVEQKSSASGNNANVLVTAADKQSQHSGVLSIGSNRNSVNISKVATGEKKGCWSGGKNKPFERKPREDTALEARKKVIRLLVVVIVTFAVCVLPYHVSVLMLSFSTGDLNARMLFNTAAYLILYLQSGLNPFLYAFLSEKFRLSMKQVFLCRMSDRNRTSIVNTFTTTAPSAVV